MLFLMLYDSLVSIKLKAIVLTINIHNIPLHVPVLYIQFYFTH